MEEFNRFNILHRTVHDSCYIRNRLVLDCDHGLGRLPHRHILTISLPIARSIHQAVAIFVSVIIILFGILLSPYSSFSLDLLTVIWFTREHLRNQSGKVRIGFLHLLW